LNRLGLIPTFSEWDSARACFYEGLRRLKAEGMKKADVCTGHDNPSAIRLYESVGFQFARRLLAYEK
jgi:ribosomal protein S18 acetylase RimI-like enzyme